MGDLRKCPADYVRIDPFKDEYVPTHTIMSNFDNSIEPQAEEQLKAGRVYGMYTAWNFCGNKVWWEDGKFHCEVWQFHSHVDTLSADTLEDLMEEVSTGYGYD